MAQFFDLGVFLAIGACLQILAQALRAWIPPFPLFAATFFLTSLGQAYQDTHANTFVASVRTGHRWLAFIHAMYMAGCLAGPFVATAVSSAGTYSQWNIFYLVPLGLGVANLSLVLFAFHDVLQFRRVYGNGQQDTPSRTWSALEEMQKTLATPSVWVLSFYFCFFLGAVVTAGGGCSHLLFPIGCVENDY